MYLKEGLIRFLKVKNVILLTAGIFFVAASFAVLTETVVTYFGDWYTILHARSTPESAVLIIVGIALIVISRLSRKLINDAGYYSAYFEGDLNGYISYEELAEVTGRTASQVRTNLHIVRPLYMKKFSFKNIDGRETVELYSKTVACICKSCGGAIEKRLYFTGECPFCGSSDLSARVISDNKFYSISDNVGAGVNKPSYYQGRALTGRLVGLAVAFGLVAVLVLIFAAVFLNELYNYNSDEYITQMILSGRSYYSKEYIRTEMINGMIFDVFGIIAAGSAIPLLVSRLSALSKAMKLSRYFSTVSTPYVSMSKLAKAGSGNSARELRGMIKALRERYLRNCSPEKHGGVLRIGLAKEIVKDRCPSCGGPIVGAVDENYQCRYCGRVIMGVVRKQGQTIQPSP